MKVPANNLLQEALQRLLERLETVQAETDARLEDAAKVAASLDKLAEVVANLELQRSQENKLLSKLENLARQLANLDREKKEKVPKKGFERSLRFFVAGTKTVGQIMEVIANSMQIMMDSIAQAINELRTLSSEKAS